MVALSWQAYMIKIYRKRIVIEKGKNNFQLRKLFVQIFQTKLTFTYGHKRGGSRKTLPFELKIYTPG